MSLPNNFNHQHKTSNLLVTTAGVAKPSAGIQTELVGIAPTTSVQIPADGSATHAGVNSKFDV
jgi:hypothetical protein